VALSNLSSAFHHLAHPRAFALTFLLSLPLSALASPPPANSASCQIDTRTPSDADLAAFHGDYKKAADLYAAALKANPTDGRSHERQVTALINQGKLDDALKLVDDWTSTNTKDPYAMVAAGDVQFAQGHWREAYALMLKALSVNPCFAPAYEGASRFETLAGYHATAHKHLTLAHQLAPTDESLLFEWTYSLNHQAASEILKDLLQNDTALDKKQKKDVADRLTSLQATSGHNCTLAPVTTPAIIPMTPMYDDRAVGVQQWGLEVAFNGHKRTLEIDTGASGFLLSHSSEAGTGLKTLTASAVGGFGDEGASGATIELADSIRIGGLELKDCRVSALNNFGFLGGSHLTNKLDNSPGIIGTNVFDRYLVTLDFLKHEVRLDPLPPPASDTAPPAPDASSEPGWYSADRTVPPSLKSWTDIYRRGHLLIVPTLINNKNPSLFIVDTGSFTNLIDIDTAKLVTREQTGMTRSIGLSGTSRLSETGKFTLDFAGLRMPVLSMDAMDLSRDGGVHGFLGYPTLNQLILHIDYRDNLILFEAPQGKKL
jgi:tetratricopeptide (TPR) repeat protein